MSYKDLPPEWWYAPTGKQIMTESDTALLKRMLAMQESESRKQKASRAYTASVVTLSVLVIALLGSMGYFISRKEVKAHDAKWAHDGASSAFVDVQKQLEKQGARLTTITDIQAKTNVVIERLGETVQQQGIYNQKMWETIDRRLERIEENEDKRWTP